LAVSEFCEEFKCLPSQALRELDNDAGHFGRRIIVLRKGLRAIRIYKGAKKAEDLPQGDPLIDLIQELEFDDAREAIARAKAQG
jgi:hypothetical protein